ncbi:MULTISPECIES: hypothetical protein [Bradyrhizobium]|uniref:Transposase n=1 Tax=Bradyrhizobium vignae TaxID=1549949 RepID=A0ABS4A797_9BRAD|nr:hypothetical protein [Bradyrhizobium vignae]MBP0116274.1 hypothetical protein [Bradyrhizobium vignae]
MRDLALKLLMSPESAWEQTSFGVLRKFAHGNLSMMLRAPFQRFASTTKAMKYPMALQGLPPLERPYGLDIWIIDGGK